MKSWNRLLFVLTCFFPVLGVAGSYKVIRDSDGIPTLISDPLMRSKPKVQDPKIKLVPLVEEISARVLIDPSLVSAVITQESGWQKFARSNKGAMGLMQLMPQTALNWGVRDPYDPQENILAGAKHLQYLLTLFDRNLPLALAAYHAGENRIIKDGTVPSIKETQAYVKAVEQTYTDLSKRRFRSNR